MMNFLLTQAHTRLEISKRYPSYNFQPISAKRYEDIDYHCRIQSITFFWQSAQVLKNVAL